MNKVVILAAACLFGRPGAVVCAQEITKTADVIKMSVTASKPTLDGKQTVVVTLVITQDWWIYGNPVEDDSLKPVETRIRLKGPGGLRNITIEYPAGTIEEPIPGFKYRKYEGTVPIKVTFTRREFDSTELEVMAHLSACSLARPLPTSQLTSRVVVPKR